MSTFRRRLLDKLLSEQDYTGNVLDIGGKKHNKRGVFRPPNNGTASWEYVNIDPDCAPDYLCPADNIPVLDASYDIVVMTEVLEHLEYPSAVIKEANRVLKKSGRLIMSSPFLFPIHADPADYQRWTKSKLELELHKAGFVKPHIIPMGSIFAVIHDLVEVGLTAASRKRGALKNKIFRRLCWPILASILLSFDNIYHYKSSYINTGYFTVAIK